MAHEPATDSRSGGRGSKASLSGEDAVVSAPAETIAAIATPAGRGGIGVVRISGPDLAAIVAGVLGPAPPPRVATVATFRGAHGEALDQGLALLFPAPASYTGETVLELHGHGGPAVLGLLLNRCLDLGARLATPGEFTKRAFLNGKLDLAQAEAVADLIDAGSVAAARAAARSLAGEFSASVEALAAALIELRTWVEAAIDFTDEDIEFLGEAGVASRLAALDASCAALERSAEQGRLLHDGYTLVIAGRPNAGKSSLLNALAGHDAAIVTAVPGTTRDVLREHIELDGLPLTILDTAGLRDGGDIVEAEGIRRARLELTRADRVLYVVDAADRAALEALPAELATLPADVPVTVVFNKDDLAPGAGASSAPSVHVSALAPAGLSELRAHLKAAAGYAPREGGTFSARRRHLEALGRTRAAIGSALSQLESGAGLELVAEELRLAHDELGEITGRFTSEELLGRIFAGFCIGK
jgi:tRNA modification GTPase